MKALAQTALVLMTAGICHAEDIRIVSFHSNGELTWSNRVTNAQYRVEWAGSITGPWLTNDPQFTVSSTSLVTTIQVPMHYRVVWLDAPPIRFTTLSTPFPYSGTVGVDVTCDGGNDLSLRSTLNSIPEGGLTAQSVHFEGIEIVTNPVPVGTMIDSNLTWQSPPVFVAGRTTLGGPFTQGPWAGITNAYMPIRLTQGISQHYGWINIQEYEYLLEGGPTNIWFKNLRLETSGYNSIPGESLEAGQTE
jgi:hypothetical protein